MSENTSVTQPHAEGGRKDDPSSSGRTGGDAQKSSVRSLSSRTEVVKKKSPAGKIVFALVVAGLAAMGYYLYNATRDEGYGDGFAGGNGRLEATEIDISTKLAGRILEIKADEGDFVTHGQKLAIMQTNVLEAQLNQARAEVIKAKATQFGAEAQIAVRQSDLTAAKATVAQRQSELEQTQRRLARSTVLSERGVITGQQFDDDETTEMAAKAAVDTANAQVGVAEAAVEAARADAHGAEAAVKAAEAQVASIQADIVDSTLVSPRDGRIQYRIAQPGEVLAAGGKVLNLVDLSDVYMNFFLPAKQAGRIAIGSEARIVLDALPSHPLPATITFVSSVAQFTPKTVETESEREKLMFRVKAKVDRKLLEDNLEMVKTGLPGVAWVRLDANQPWPEELQVKR